MHIPRWAWLLLPLMFIGIGLVLMLIVIESASTRLTVTFPVSAEVARGRTRRIQTAWAVGAGVPVLCAIVGVAGHSSGAILGSAIVVGVLSILIAAGIAGSGQSWQRGKLTADGRLILRKVAPEWKDARDALLYQARMYFEQQAAIAHQQAMYLAQQQAAFGGGYNASAAPSGYWPSAPQAGNPR